MKFRMKKITALMAAAVLGVSTFGGVSVMAAESTEAMAVPADQAGMVVDDDAVAAEGDAIPSDFIQGTFKPSEITVQAQDSYEYPFLGLSMKLPEELLKQIKAQTIAMITNEVWNDNADAIKYAYISWSEMTEEQKEQVRSRVRQSGKALYKQRKAAGLCVRCGKPAQKGYVRCYECNIKNTNCARRRRNRKLSAKAPGICCWCSNPVKPGFKLCQAHYNRQVEILNRARSSSAVKESVAVLWKMIKMPQRH